MPSEVTEINNEAALEEEALEAQRLASPNFSASVNTATPEEEEEARQKGWRPEAEYTGDKSKWVDAKTFLKRGERFTKNLEKKIEKLEAQIAGFEGTKAAFRAFFDREMKKRDEEHAVEVSALKAQLRAAVREGDDATADLLEERLDTVREQHRIASTEAKKLAEEKTTEPTSQTPTTANAEVDINPVLREWVADGNEWFDTDPALQKYATELAAYMRKQGETLIGREFLDKVEAQVRKDFPRRFRELEAKSGQRNSPTGTGGSQGSNNPKSRSGVVVNGKTKADLPPEDREIMDQLIRDKVYTEESFLKSYFSRNA